MYSGAPLERLTNRELAELWHLSPLMYELRRLRELSEEHRRDLFY